MLSSKRILIIDCGSFSVKAGFSNDGYPKLIFFTNKEKFNKIINRKSETSNGKQFIEFLDKPESWIYNEHLNVEKLKSVLDYIYSELKIDPKNTPVLYAAPSTITEDDKKVIADLFFQTYKSPKLLIVKQSELILHAMWQRTGIVLDLGHTSSTCIPYFEGFEITPAIKKTKLGGYTLIKEINKFTIDSINFHLSIGDIPKILNGNFYVASNYDLEKTFHDRGLASKEYVKKIPLSESDEILIDDIKFKIPELLFQPSLLGISSPSVSDIIKESIMSCPVDLRRPMMKNIIIAGGVAKLPGIELRLKNELTAYFPIDYYVKIIAHQKREWTAWIGGDTIVTKNIPLERFWSQQIK